MGPKIRAKKDIEKLEQILKEFKSLGFNKKYPLIFDWVKNYLADAKHFYSRKDYFSAFGAANYAFGIIDGILIIENKK